LTAALRLINFRVRVVIGVVAKFSFLAKINVRVRG